MLVGSVTTYDLIANIIKYSFYCFIILCSLQQMRTAYLIFSFAYVATTYNNYYLQLSESSSMFFYSNFPSVAFQPVPIFERLLSFFSVIINFVIVNKSPYYSYPFKHRPRVREKVKSWDRSQLPTAGLVETPQIERCASCS